MGYAERLRRYEEAKKALPPMNYAEYEKAIKPKTIFVRAQNKIIK